MDQIVVATKYIGPIFFPAAFKPTADWEKHQRYVPGTDFLNTDYVSGCANPADFRVWREFLH